MEKFEYYFKGKPTGIITTKKEMALSTYVKHTGVKISALEFLGNGSFKKLKS